MKDIKNKIAKLLALADSPNENEARAALLKARELMAEYKLRPEEVSLGERSRVIRQTVGITCTKLTNPWAVTLSVLIANHYCCRAYMSHVRKKKTTTIGFIGLEDDFDVCSRIFQYAFSFVEGRCKEIRSSYKDFSRPAELRQYTKAYGDGFCTGLAEAFREQTQHHSEWGLALITPQPVLEAASDLKKGGVYSKPDFSAGNMGFAFAGFKDGKRFDPSTKLEEKSQTA